MAKARIRFIFCPQPKDWSYLIFILKFLTYN